MKLFREILPTYVLKFLLCFREGEGRKKERARNIDWLPSAFCLPPVGAPQARTPINLRLLGLWDTVQPTEPCWPGPPSYVLAPYPVIVPYTALGMVKMTLRWVLHWTPNSKLSWRVPSMSAPRVCGANKPRGVKARLPDTPNACPSLEAIKILRAIKSIPYSFLPNLTWYYLFLWWFLIYKLFIF